MAALVVALFTPIAAAQDVEMGCTEGMAGAGTLDHGPYDYVASGWMDYDCEEGRIWGNYVASDNELYFEVNENLDNQGAFCELGSGVQDEGVSITWGHPEIDVWSGEGQCGESNDFTVELNTSDEAMEIYEAAIEALGQ